MIRTNTTDALTTTCLILFVIALIDGKYAPALTGLSVPCVSTRLRISRGGHTAAPAK
jgi:hypothetical protein